MGTGEVFRTSVVVTGKDLGEPGPQQQPLHQRALRARAGQPAVPFEPRRRDLAQAARRDSGGHAGRGDSDLAIDPGDGSLYWSDLWLGNMTVAVSHDQGASWSAQPFGGPPEDRQWDATPGGGRAYLITHQIPSGLVVSKSVDGGITYPVQTVAATPTDQTG